MALFRARSGWNWQLNGDKGNVRIPWNRPFRAFWGTSGTVMAWWAYLDTVLDFSLSSPEGGEGWGEEALGFSAQFPSPRPLPAWAGRGVKDSVKMHP